MGRTITYNKIGRFRFCATSAPLAEDPWLDEDAMANCRELFLAGTRLSYIGKVVDL